MRRRELLTGSAALGLSASVAHAFGVGQLGANMGRLGVLGGAGFPPLPPGFTRGPGYIMDGQGNKFIFLLTPDGTAYEQGQDGQYLFTPYP